MDIKACYVFQRRSSFQRTYSIMAHSLPKFEKHITICNTTHVYLNSFVDYANGLRRTKANIYVIFTLVGTGLFLQTLTTHCGKFQDFDHHRTVCFIYKMWKP